MDFFRSLGVFPLLSTFVSLFSYGLLLRSRANQVLAYFFSSLFIGSFVSALLFSELVRVRPPSVFAAQCLAAAVFLLLLKIALRYSKASRPIFIISDRGKDQLALIGIGSALAIAAVAFLSVDLEAKCTTFRCRGFDFFFGETGSFPYYYIVSLLGTTALFVILAVTFNIFTKPVR